MVGRDENAVIAVSLQGISEGADNVAGDPGERLALGSGAGLVAGLVGGLGGDANDVVVLQRLDTVSTLSGIIRVEVAGRSRDVDPVPACQDADAADQVD